MPNVHLDDDYHYLQQHVAKINFVVYNSERWERLNAVIVAEILGYCPIEFKAQYLNLQII